MSGIEGSGKSRWAPPFECPECGEQFDHFERFLGELGYCPHCNNRVSGQIIRELSAQEADR